MEQWLNCGYLIMDTLYPSNPVHNVTPLRGSSGLQGALWCASRRCRLHKSLHHLSPWHGLFHWVFSAEICSCCWYQLQRCWCWWCFCEFYSESSDKMENHIHKRSYDKSKPSFFFFFLIYRMYYITTIEIGLDYI